MAKQKIDFESFSVTTDNNGPGFVIVLSAPGDTFFVLTRLYAVPVKSLRKFHCVLKESGFIPRVPYEAVCKKNKPQFIKILLRRKTVKKDLKYFVQALVQSRVLESVVVCDMTSQWSM